MQEMQETWVQFLGGKDPLEEVMTTHSSTLAWRIPWTEVPGGLQSMGHKELDMTEATEHICTRITYVLCRLIKYEIYHNIHQ